MQNLSPKAEPIVWANAAALIVAALIEYGVPITDSFGKLLVLALPFLLANLWARYQVWAADTHAEAVQRAAAAAYDDGRKEGVQSASMGIRTGPGTFTPRQNTSRFH